MSTAGWKETRVLIALAMVGFAVAAAITVTLQHGHNQAPPAVLTSVARAAYVTGSQPGYAFELQVEAGGAGQSFTMTANGSVNPNGNGSLHLTADGITIDEILAYPEVYIRTPSLPTGTALAPTPWVKINAGAMMQSLGAGSSISGDSDPSKMLDYLKASSAVTTVGPERVRGVLTTHYHALIDLDRYPSVVPSSQRGAASQAMALLKRVTGQSQLPMDTWVDGRTRVRRVQIQMPVCTSAGTFSESLSMDIFDYGRQPAVATPDPSQVTDVTPRITAGAAASVQQLGC